MKTKLGRLGLSLAIVAGPFVTGCSSFPDSIGPSYVSPLEYQSYSCSQLGQEIRRLGRRVQEVAGYQSDEAVGDAVALGIGLVLWPALFFLIGGDREEELERIKGEAEAVEQAAIQKDCRGVLERIDQKRRAATKRAMEVEAGKAIDNDELPVD